MPTPADRPPKLWLAKRLAAEKLAALARWRPRMPTVDWASARLRFASAAKLALSLAACSLLLCALPPLATVAMAHGARSLGLSESLYTPRLRPIDATSANADLWASAVATIHSESLRALLANEWEEAYARAKQLHSGVAMIDEAVLAKLTTQLAASNSLDGAKRRDAVLEALIVGLRSHASDAQILSQARDALALADKADDPISRLPTRFGPAQPCSGGAYLKTMLPLLTAPEGACMAMTDDTRGAWYFNGLLALFIIIATLLMLALVAWWAKATLSAWARDRAALHLARWERQQMASGPPPAQERSIPPPRL